MDVVSSLMSWVAGKLPPVSFVDILDVETGGMMEVWCDLYEITGDNKYQTLMERYYRERLFEPLLKGDDVLTNLHANTTIPEVLGCARAYEVTGEEKWTPMKKLKARLGDKNQEHCTVYNMIRLAEFLFRYTKDPSYMDYIERNVHNGILSQTYWRGASYQGVLAGICENERVLKLQSPDPLEELSMDTERQWGDFQTYFKTETQDPGISFKRLCEIGYEPYQVYFKIL